MVRVCCFLLLVSACTSVEVVEIEVSSGTVDRPLSVIHFDFGRAAGTWQATDEKGTVTLVQVARNGTAALVLKDLAGGEVRTLQLRPASSEVKHVEARREGQLIRFSNHGRDVTAYHAGKHQLPRADIDSIYLRDGYLHPVYSPNGRLITDDYPPNHIHHHGIWAAWTVTRFQGRAPDFWNMGRGTGKVEVVALDSVWSGPVYGGLESRHQYVDLLGHTAALEEEWRLESFAGSPSLNMFDLRIVQRTATDSALVLPSHLYGGVGFRGHRDWNGAENTDFLTSEGRTRLDGHATRARWCHIGGLVEGDSVGIAILGHPSNLEAPQPMRIHPDEPFFNFAPSQAGDSAILPGTDVEWKYRFVTYDGSPDPDLLDALWEDYAQPAGVRVLR